MPFSPCTVAVCFPPAFAAAGPVELNDPGKLAGDQETAFTPIACAWNFSPSAEPSSVHPETLLALDVWEGKSDVHTLELQNGYVAVA